MAYNETPYERITTVNPANKYSYLGSSLHISVSDDVAATFNRVQDKIFAAQLTNYLTTGVQWIPVLELDLKLTDGETIVYGLVLRLVDFTAENQGKTKEQLIAEITGTHLIKL